MEKPVFLNREEHRLFVSLIRMQESGEICQRKKRNFFQTIFGIIFSPLRIFVWR